MSFAAGTRLGPYEIQSRIGEGGMGEVYAARDLRLDRKVAIKTIRSIGVEDRAARERFRREARLVAGLNHPNICTLHDIGSYEGTEYIVMEFLDGKTVEDRLKQGPMPITDALEIAQEIADALYKAHQHGIVHRDIKPSNVMLTKSGAKLLDFGVAELISSELGQTVLAQSGSETAPVGISDSQFIGSVKYAAPEQFRGGPVDARTDVWSLGVVLYEMVAGHAPFGGKTFNDFVSMIVNTEPPMPSTVRPEVPPALDNVIRVCLNKDPADRWQSPHDMGQMLRWIERNEAGRPSQKIKTRGLTTIFAVAAFALAVALAAVVARRPGETFDSFRLSILPPSNITITPASEPYLAISPDGTTLAFVGSDGARPPSLWVRPLNSVEARALPGTDDASYPFWSPDSRHLGFFSQGKLKRIDTRSGQPLPIAGAPNGTGGTWSIGGTIVFAPDGTVGGLQRVSASGGPVSIIKPRDPSRQETVSWQPSFLPDGVHFLYLMGPPISVHVGSLDSPDLDKQIINADSKAVYTKPGYLLFVRAGTLMAQKFDAKSLMTEGVPIQIADRVTYNPISGVAAFSLADERILTYRSGSSSLNSQLVWSDRAGNILGRVDQERSFAGIDLSHDSRTIVTHLHEGSGGDLWLIDALRGAAERVTFEPERHFVNPVFSPDGREIAFAAVSGQSRGLYRMLVRSGQKPELLLSPAGSIWPADWTSDGQNIVYVETDAQRKQHLWVMSLKDKQTRQLFSSSFNESAGQVSPNRKWIAYLSDESGRDEISLRPFPSSGRKWQVSAGGGAFPRWRPDSKELFFVSNNVLTAVQIDEKTGEPGVAKSLFPVKLTQTSSHSYAVVKNGEQFLLSRRVDDPTSFATTVIVNWLQQSASLR